MINSPIQLVSELKDLFPGFGARWDDGRSFGYAGEAYSYHSIMLTFGPISSKLFAEASPDQLMAFCRLLNEAVAQGGKFENAVSTCFLEHASQMGVRAYIRPYLSQKARCKLR